MTPAERRARGAEHLENARRELLEAAKHLNDSELIGHHHALCALTDVCEGMRAVAKSEAFDRERAELERKLRGTKA